MNKVILNGVDLKIEDVVNVARKGYEVEIDKDCMAHIAEVRNYMESEWMRDDAPAVYGFNTGLGKHKDHKVTIEESDLHQYRTVLSHCGGVGDPAPEEVVRAAMCVRLNAFCRGVSGLRPVVVERLVELLNKGVHPVVPWQGSVGACGDLAPMAHIVSVLIGVPQAEAFYQGERMPAQEALKKASITPVEFQLKAKDCLALLNGTTMFAGMACLNVHDAERLYKLSEITTALSLEAIRGETRAFDKRIQEARPYAGQIKAAANVMRLVEGSTRVTEDARKVHLEHDIMHPHYQERVQDNYCFRCMPQVQGVCRENLDYVKHLVEVEINAATDNPLIFPKGDAEQSGSEALFDLLKHTQIPRRVLIARGQTGREWLAEQLTQLGADVEKLAAYVRVPIELSTQQIEDLQKAIHGPSPIIYITSSDSVATLLHAIRPVPGAREWFLHGAAVTIHPRCAERLREAGFVHVEITGTLDERVREHIVSNLLRLT